MQATSSTSSTSEQAVSAIKGATQQRTRWLETTYATVSWDYPPSPAAYYDALLYRGASHSRFLRIAYSSTRLRPSTSASNFLLVSSSATSSANALDTSSFSSDPHLTLTAPLTCSDGSHRKPAIHVPPTPPYPLSRSCVNVRPRSANPMSHTLKRRKPQWPKPPHYHASLLRSPLSHRKGLFRAVLPPNKAVDFFRWDVLVGAGVSLSASCQERDWTRSGGDACASVHVAESVLEPYEVAAGFFGWHGLGLDVARRVQGNDDDDVCVCCWSERHGLECNGARKSGSLESRFEIDEALVEQGRARWVRTAEELVGPPGLALQSFVEELKSGKVVLPSDPSHNDTVDVHPSSLSSRWDLDIGPSPLGPRRAASAFDEKRRSPLSSSTASVPTSSPTSKPEPKSDSPLTWWCGPSPLRGPPPASLPALRFLSPPSVQYGPPPAQFPPWLPGGRVASAQGHGICYGAQSVGAASPVTRDPNVSKPLQPHSYPFATPVTPTSVYPTQSSRYPNEPTLDRDEHGSGHDDKETETDHGYESTTTTTDSDPPPHTPIGAAATSHCVEAFQIHGDDEVEVHGVEIDGEHAAASVTIRLSDPSTPVKLLDRFSVSASPSPSSSSPDSNREGCESFKAAVVFPSLNGSFCQGSTSPTSVSLFGSGMSAQTTPARTVTPASSSSLSSTKESSTRPEEDSKTKLGSRGAGASAGFVSGDGLAFTLSCCSPPSTSPRPGLRKDSQGFWEPVTPASPSSSSSSLPLSPSEVKMGSSPTAGLIGDETGAESSEAASPSSTHCTKSRSLSPGPRCVASAGSTSSSSSRPATFTSSTSTSMSASVFGGSHPSSPSPNGSTLVPPNQTAPLPAFLTTATVKRKKTSRTREIVDRLRSFSVGAGKGGVGSDDLGWLAGPSAGGEVEGKLGRPSIGSDHAAGNHVAGGQSSPSALTRSSTETGSGLGKKEGKAVGSRTCEGGSSGIGGKSNGAMQAAHASPRTVTPSTNPAITPFPILSVSQPPASNFAVIRQSQSSGTCEREPVIATPPKSAEGSKMNAGVVTSPTARSSGQLVPSTLKGSASPSAHPCHPPIASPSHPTVRPPPPLGPPPPPILAVSPSLYPHPVYVPFTQYHIAPAHQGQQGQGTWVAVYPGRPPQVPVHPIPAQTHIAPITGVSGMRHVTW